MESLEVLVVALKVQHEEVKPLGVKVFRAKTKVQSYGGLMNNTVQSSCMWGEHKVTKSFTHLGSAVHNNDGSPQEVTQ